MNPHALKAAEIKHTGVSRVLVAYLEAELETHKNSLIVVKDSDILRQLQGRAQQLNELIKFFSEKTNA